VKQRSPVDFLQDLQTIGETVEILGSDKNYRNEQLVELNPGFFSSRHRKSSIAVVLPISGKLQIGSQLKQTLGAAQTASLAALALGETVQSRRSPRQVFPRLLPELAPKGQ
jgi:hypothetical protein